MHRMMVALKHYSSARPKWHLLTTHGIFGAEAYMALVLHNPILHVVLGMIVAAFESAVILASDHPAL